MTTNRVIAFQSCTNESVPTGASTGKSQCFKYPVEKAEQVICYCSSDRCNTQKLIDEFLKDARGINYGIALLLTIVLSSFVL
uniref:Activin_recp domain-containing protein n=1 Tax=Steinernema glaseri TaxID=37863 RepID=A0A1I7Z524_9BILA